MELEVSAPLEFNFHSTSSSPFVSPPSSPLRFFLSVPSSPTRPLSPSSASVIQQPHHQDHLDTNLDFQFDFSGQLLHHTDSVSADQLFYAGKIRPLKPPLPAPKLVIRRTHSDFDSDSDSKFNQFTSEESGKEDEEGKEQSQRTRGRSGRASSISFFPASSASSSRRGSRSMSPLRAPSYSDADDDDDDEDFSSSTSNNNHNNPIPKPSSSSSSFLSSISFTKKGYRKWRLKDFLLFRSASEGRAAVAGKDPLRKYAVLSKKAAAAEEELPNSGSFRSTESGSGSVSSRRRGPVSAHEMHYTLNRAASEEMKKKTVLPYKQLGPLGCLGFTHDITKGIQSLTR